MTQSRKLYIATVLMLLFGIGYNFYKRPFVPTEPVSAPAVVELFSSKLCPACPPAEQSLAALSKDPNVIALSCHVSYLDFGNNKDPHARDFCEVRQHGYAKLLANKRVYTPFMVINGENGFMGSNSWSLSSALKNAENNPPIALELTEDLGRTVKINLPDIKTSEPLRVWVFGYNPKESDNPKRPVTNPAESLDNLGSWDGKAETRQIQVINQNIRNLLVLVQENGYGRIVAAGRLSLR